MKSIQSKQENVPQLSRNALKVLERRYLLRNEKRKLVETPSQLFRRVAKAVASAEQFYDPKVETKYVSDEFYRTMLKLEFLPNSPTLMNAGTRLGQLSACFVLPVEDSLSGILRPIEFVGLIQQSGGGIGFSFSNLRPRGDIVKTTMGDASGPVSFMRIYDTATDVIKQGGRRRGATMGILRVDHPDIKEFITAKSDENSFTNFNLSVAVTEDFMRRVKRDEEYDLINPRTKKPEGSLPAKEVFNLIVTQAWKTGDPGIVFIDEINRHNPTPHIGEIESTNPCGEQPLLPYESCNLGSIDVSKFVRNNNIDWHRLRETVRLAVRFLDDVIDVNKYPLPEVKEITIGNRKIGLGVMGFADMLIKLGIPYNSNQAITDAKELMKFINEEARNMSVELAHSRGSFPNFKGSIWERKGFKAIRNAAITTIAPTGTISIVAGCSSGIEPLFAVVYVRNVLNGTRMLEIHPIFERVTREQGFYSEKLIKKIAKTGSIQHFKQIPGDVRRIFVTAHDISPEWHVRMQAAFQKHCDNAVSKTVNLPHEATPKDVEMVFKLAYELKCKGITVYRNRSKRQQVLQYGSSLVLDGDKIPGDYLSAKSEYSGGCPTRECPF